MRLFSAFLSVTLVLLSAQANAALTAENLKEIGYYDHLDYSDAKIARSIPEFEKKLEALIGSAKSQEAGMAAVSLASIAMFMVNTNYGIRDGKIAAPGFSQADIPARNSKITALLNEAIQFKPEQPLIQNWIEGQKVREANGEGFSRLLDLATTDPVFHLFSTLILAQDVNLTTDQAERLFQLVQTMTSKDGPCRKKNRKEGMTCEPTAYAPFSYQGSSLLLGDSYLRKASEGGPLRQKYAIKAWVIYNMPGWKPASRLKTLTWRFAEDLKERRKMAQAAALGKDFKLVSPEFWKTEKAHRPYMCASCHTK